ncbi:hypothetical protein PUN28_016842 [Cardiocondyla obscurior]|uniref:tRNA-splicing endonuclease subunit Sen15 domain-containing protein n=1 Tax=Cardiocondyla obscurior TaxID=286306 RepID=A0AAW2ET75_9HYME
MPSQLKRFADVKYKYNEELDVIYFEVKKREHSQPEIYVPWSTKYNLFLENIEKMQQLLQNDRLTFVFKSEDSSSVFYTVNAGLSKPAAPEVSKLQKEKTEKKLNLESEVRRNIPNIYELARACYAVSKTDN